MSTSICPECGGERETYDQVCVACGAPPALNRQEPPDKAVRRTDLEPYIALKYIAALFKILAVLILILLFGEVALGLLIDGRSSVTTLLGEATRLLVLAGMLWAGGDVALLMIDVGHDLRVARILLGRINAQLHSEPDAAPRVKESKSAPELVNR